MDGEGTVDQRLISLAECGPHHFETVQVLAATQNLIASRLGHILALNDEYVWRRIQAAAAAGTVPTVNVRCLRCGWSALLRQWVAIAPLESAERERHADMALRGPDPYLAKAMQPCKGGAYADIALGQLEMTDVSMDTIRRVIGDAATE